MSGDRPYTAEVAAEVRQRGQRVAETLLSRPACVRPELRGPVDRLVRAVFEMGPNVGVDRVPDEVIRAKAIEAGVDESLAMLEFIAAAHALHVEQWARGLSTEQYQHEHRVRAGRVNLWAAVLRTIPAGGAA